MYPMAVNAGIPADEYWGMTIREITIQAQANRQRHMDELRERAVMDHKLSELMAYAVNEPNKIPGVDKMYGFLEEKADEPKEEIPEWKKDQIEFMKQAELIRAARNSKK